MKKLSVLLVALILVLALSACGSSINREEALDIALEKAGVTKTDIRDLEIELDHERGKKVWEIDFDHGDLEYSYDIDAESGAITEVERERDR